MTKVWEVDCTTCASPVFIDRADDKWRHWAGSMVDDDHAPVVSWYDAERVFTDLRKIFEGH